MSDTQNIQASITVPFGSRLLLSRKASISAGDMERFGLVLVLNHFGTEPDPLAVEEIHGWVNRQMRPHPGLFAAFELSGSTIDGTQNITLFQFKHKLGYDLFLQCWEQGIKDAPAELFN